MTHGDEEAIRQRAYDIWISEGCPDGAEERHWQQAEEELGVGTSVSDITADTNVPPSPAAVPSKAASKSNGADSSGAAGRKGKPGAAPAPAAQ